MKSSAYCRHSEILGEEEKKGKRGIRGRRKGGKEGGERRKGTLKDVSEAGVDVMLRVQENSS